MIVIHEPLLSCAQAKQAADEALRLQHDKQALIDTVKKLNRDVAKLEAFKKDLLQHLQEDEVGGLNLAAVDLSSERLLNEVLTSSALKGPYTSSYSSSPARAYQAIPSPSLSPSHFSTSDAATTPLNVDGKQFFSLARSKLSYEAFSSFLHNIKELNAGRQTKEMTLMRCKEVFGAQGHEQLYVTFEQLLNKAASSFGA
jgi:hypothetical protein